MLSRRLLGVVLVGGLSLLIGTSIAAAQAGGQPPPPDANAGVARQVTLSPQEQVTQAELHSGADSANLGSAHINYGTILARVDPSKHAQAIAVPYLMLSGYAMGGWLMAKSHAIAAAKAADDPEFHASKQQLARFYAEQLLPNTLALARIVANGTDSVLTADPSVM